MRKTWTHLMVSDTFYFIVDDTVFCPKDDKPYCPLTYYYIRATLFILKRQNPLSSPNFSFKAFYDFLQGLGSVKNYPFYCSKILLKP